MIKNIHKHFVNDKVFQTCHYSGIKNISSDESIAYSTKLYTDMFEMLLDSRGKRNFIFDRAHYGEMVYGPKYRGYTGEYVLDIEKNYVDKLQDELYLVVLIDDPKSLLKRDDGLSISNRLDDIEDEVSKFRDAFCKSNIHSKDLIFVKGLDQYEVAKRVIKFIS